MNRETCYHNPILSGFYPDPSICRVGDDYYLVNSSFAFFPGLPLWHSKDLVHWRQIGNAIDRPSQMNFAGAGSSRGLFAPTLREFEGRFYIVCTLVDQGGNFLITADRPEGPWSDPIWLGEAKGIDPSLYFEKDRDGGEARAWYCGTREDSRQARYWGDNEIYLQELDLKSLQLVGEAKPIWKGALRDSVWAEGPHIYRIGGYYYLLISEGGTSRDHAMTIARSQSLQGPYVGKKSNPLLTHRDLGSKAAIQCVGHGDIVQDSAGDWWLVHLATRPQKGFTVLGRETFLTPLIWEEDWPLPSPESGRVLEYFPSPKLPAVEFNPEPACQLFDGQSRLGPDWLSLRLPASDFASLRERAGYLRVKLQPGNLREKRAVSFLGKRLAAHDWLASCALEFQPESEEESAGLALFQSEDFNYRLVLTHAAVAEGYDSSSTRKEPSLCARLLEARGKEEDRVLASKPYSGNTIVFSAFSRNGSIQFLFGPSQSELQLLYACEDCSGISVELAGGFIGSLAGIYASSSGASTQNCADFRFFENRAL